MAITFRGLTSPPSTATGKLYYATDSYNSLSVYDGTGWRPIQSSKVGAWEERVIYTKGYMMGGYRNSSPWINVNKTMHMTDITTNLGDKLDAQAGYVSGGFSDTRGYCYGTINAFPGNTNHVSAFVMATETGANVSGSMTDSKDDSGQFQNHDNTRAWVYGGDADDVCRHQFSSESFSHCHDLDSTNNQNTNMYGDGGWGFMSKGSYKMHMGNETYTTMQNVVGGQTHSKSMPTKHYKCFVENNGNSTTANDVMMYNTVTETNQTAYAFKPWTGGEDNFEQGQNWGYSLGHCGIGCQSNHAYKTWFHTHGHVAGGTSMEPKGHGGASSGGCASTDLPG